MNKTSTLKALIDGINPDTQHFYPGFKDSEENVEQIEVELTCFKEYLTSKQVIAAMADKGLEMVSFHELASYVLSHPEVSDQSIATIRDGDESLTFHRWGGGCHVHVSRSGFRWDGYWWFAGRRKFLKTLPREPLSFVVLEVEIDGRRYRLIED